MASPQAQTIRLAAEDDPAAFRAHCRCLLHQGVAPSQVDWQVAGRAEADLFDASPGGVTPMPASAQAPGTSPLQVSAAFAALFDTAALHADAGRFALLYRRLWRLAHDPASRGDPLDADHLQIEQWAREVRRDIHKMTAFVRFRPLRVSAGHALASAPGQALQHVAWFEPGHHVVRAAAPFFQRRFAQMDWAILTPRGSVHWDGQHLRFGPAAQRSDAPPADADERLWLTYYASIFNPARLKLAMMHKEMPRRYWKNLPEAVLISPLAARAAERSGAMIERAAGEPPQRRPAASSALRLDQRHRLLPAAGSVAALEAAVAQCRECPLGARATQAVCGQGPRPARLMLVGEQPGDREDLLGKPFVGPVGQLLDHALGRLGWARETLYLTHAVKHFKHELRGRRRIHKTPDQREVQACQHWLEAELTMVQPAAVLALGVTAAGAVMGRPVQVTVERGQWLDRSDGVRVLVTVHPAALLRMPPADQPAAFERWLADLSMATPLLLGSGATAPAAAMPSTNPASSPA